MVMTARITIAGKSMQNSVDGRHLKLVTVNSVLSPSFIRANFSFPDHKENIYRIYTKSSIK